MIPVNIETIAATVIGAVILWYFGYIWKGLEDARKLRAEFEARVDKTNPLITQHAEINNFMLRHASDIEKIPKIEITMTEIGTSLRVLTSDVHAIRKVVDSR